MNNPKVSITTGKKSYYSRKMQIKKLKLTKAEVKFIYGK